jgi:hypothetical protein
MKAELLIKLDEFIRKFYKNRVIRGSMISGGLLLLLLLIILPAQYFGQFNVLFRTILFYSFLSVGFGVFVFLILIPLLKMFRLGKVIGYDEAAKIIGKYFPEVSDKLLNALQLQRQGSSVPGTSLELLEAGINQKISELRPVPFTNAIDLTLNRRFLPVLMLPLFFITAIYLIKPAVITDSAKKIVRHSSYFEKPSPFTWQILNSNLRAIQNKDFELSVKLTADAVPEQVFLETKGFQYKLENTKEGIYKYHFSNLQQDVEFAFFADGFYSGSYQLKVLPEPSILSFMLRAVFPAYVGKKEELLSNNGELVCPEGTRLTWTFDTRNTDALQMQMNGKSKSPETFSNGKFVFSHTVKNTFQYQIFASNKLGVPSDTLRYQIVSVPDNFPTIQASQLPDSMQTGDIMYLLEGEDDYGLTACRFYFEVLDNSGKTIKKGSAPIPFDNSGKSQMIPFAWNISASGINRGDQLKYFFEITDNDAVNGPKTSRSREFLLQTKTEEQLHAEAGKSRQASKSAMQKSISRAKEIERELNELNKKIQEKKILTYDEIKKMKDLLDKQKMLEKEVEQVKNENMKMMNEQMQFSEQKESLLEKQKQLEKLFNEVLPPELKEKIKELEKMLQEMNKEKMQQALEDMKKDTKDIEKELDRTLSLFKQMEFEEKLKNTIGDIEKLADKEEKLAEESKKGDISSDELKKNQENIEKDFSELTEQMKELGKQAEELEMEQKDLFGDQMQEKQKDIQNDMKESSSQLQQNKKKKASETQSKASQKMKQMANQMQSMAASMEADEKEEDLKSLRVILENLLRLSFNQEDLMKRFASVDRNNPQYVKLNQEQKKLQEDAKVIEDSLFALSKRQPQMEAYVNREISSIRSNMEKAIRSMADRNVPEGASRQQYVMTSINNLALILSESFEQMQQQMANSKPGSGKCSKPGGSGQGKGKKPSVAQMKKMQEQINRQIEKLKSELEKEKASNQGKKPSKEKGRQGPPTGRDGQSTSEQLARMAAQQEAIRRELQKAADQMKKDGKDPSGNLRNLADMMDKTENDLVNKNITRETIRRQQEIMNRLLEAENAEREREQDEKRTSSAPQNEIFSNPDKFLAYKTQKMKEAEMIKTIPANLQPFFKSKINRYYNTLKK